MPNRWTNFVKEWASKNDMTYGCALSKPECKNEYHKKFPKPLTKKQQKFREAIERGAMEDEDINRAKKMPSKESREAFKMTSEDLLSRRTNKEWRDEAKENIRMSIEDKPPTPAPAPIPAPKKRGRKPKYATEEEKKKAKREQTLASNKRLAEMRKEYLNQAREQLKMKDEDKNVAGKGILKNIRKGLKRASKAVRLGAEQSVGFVKDTAKKVGEVAAETAEDVREYGKAVIYGRMDYPPKVRTILKKYGEEVITGYKIKRTPVSKLLTSALSVVSLGVFGKRFGRSAYDELFHLFLEMTTASGKRISVEKNEVINMDTSPPKRDKEEVKDITTNIPEGLTISAMMAKTEESMGKKKFFGYSARDNNCQDFIVAILRSNNIGDNSDIEFVKQDTKELFKNLPFLRKFANTITDLGARVNVITTGAGVGGEDYIVQSVVFSKDQWTTPKAKKWLKENGYVSPKVDRKTNTLRFRQRDPDEAEKEGFTEYRTKDLSDSGIQLILSYKKKILSNTIKKMPRFAKGSEEAKEWGRKMREKRAMKGGAVKPSIPIDKKTLPVMSGPEAEYRTMGKGIEMECEVCPMCKRTMEVEMEGGKIRIGRAFKKAGRAIKKGIQKEVLKPAGKALAPVGEYITAKKGGLATDLIKYGIPAATGTALGLAGTVLGPAQGMVASAIGTKLGAMGAAELQKATGTGMCGSGGGASKPRKYDSKIRNDAYWRWIDWIEKVYNEGGITPQEMMDHLDLEVMKARTMGSTEEEDGIEDARKWFIGWVSGKIVEERKKKGKR